MPSLRCTKDLLMHFDLISDPSLPESPEDWYAHRFLLNRRQHVLFCHGETGFCSVTGPLLKSQMDSLPSLLRTSLTFTMSATGYAEETVERYLESLGDLPISRATRGTGLATTSHAVQEIKWWCADTTPQRVPLKAVDYNTRPVKRLEYQNPIEVFSVVLGVAVPGETDSPIEKGEKAPVRPPSSICAYCHEVVEETDASAVRTEAMREHLESCAVRTEEIRKEGKDGRGEAEPILHLLVGSSDFIDYRLHLEMPGSTSLESLDDYLRKIWLECCGHMSAFWPGEPWKGMELPMSLTIAEALSATPLLSHVYDFGSSTFTFVEHIGTRTGIWSHPKQIVLMARNRMPDLRCMFCNRAGTWICMECLYEEKGSGVLCDLHERSHPHDAYGDPLPLLNSPRSGVCGYIGPAEAP